MGRPAIGASWNGFLELWRLSLWRGLRSRQTLINGLLLGFALMVATAWSLHHERSARDFVEDLLLPLYVSFLMPIFCLCYASASVSGDRQDQTLVYVLATALPRSLIYTAKYLAALTLVLAWNLAGFALLARVAGVAGQEVFARFWPTVLWASLAYAGLFHLFSVTLRRATIVALVYTLFLETFLGNMPGIVKRVAISFYAQCMIFEQGLELGMGPAGGRNPQLFLPVSGQIAWIVLAALAGLFFVAGCIVFSRQEYV